MILLNTILAMILGYFTGRFMGLTVQFLPEILLEGCDEGREPRNIIGWFFQDKIPKTTKIFLFQWLMAILFGFSALIFPLEISLIFLLSANCILICCFFTDYEYGILPDQLTLSFVWLGLIGSLFSIIISPSESIAGAIFGYGIFWMFNEIYRHFRGMEGMYPGDFKLNAGIGACVGVKLLIPILAISLVLLIVTNILNVLLNKKNDEENFLYKEVPYACSATIVAIMANYLILAKII